ncbi:hypothetical protein BS78_10G016200 [Paspalum vaginatum]|uniref:Uncharacterized protein n=1 Tax=Paspalum vaginatum TaxID=158149 RepID=A0A9W8CCQ0_9POAL|nr:hypothetical protein BS78_K176000 [Paspalum vaginatum]KAJ1257700.1 hypothetical protein BS78_10G016200 [Paspalum vaginatum]
MSLLAVESFVLTNQLNEYVNDLNSGVDPADTRPHDNSVARPSVTTDQHGDRCQWYPHLVDRFVAVGEELLLGVEDERAGTSRGADGQVQVVHARFLECITLQGVRI